MEYNNTIFIGDLSYFCTKRDLEELFCSYGKIVNIRIKQNEGKKKSLSFGFVQFSTHEEAINALNKLNGEMFLGRVLRYVSCSYLYYVTYIYLIYILDKF